MAEEKVRAMYCNDITLKMAQHRADSKFCDINIRVGQELFKCHRLVLSSTSEYFNAMFKASFSEGSSQEIILTELDARVFEVMLQFMYSGEAAISRSNLYDVFCAADFYQVPRLLELCIIYIEKNLDAIADIILNIFWYAHSARMNDLVCFLKRLIYENFGYFSNIPEFVNLSVDSLLEILELMARMPVRPFQDLFFEGIYRWITGQKNMMPEELVLHSRRLLAKIDRLRFSSKYAERLAMLAADESTGGCIHAPIVLHDRPELLRAYVSTLSRSGLPKEHVSIFTGFSSPFANPWAYSGEVVPFPYEYMENVVANNCIYCLGYSRGRNQTFRCSTSASMDPYSSLSLPPFDYAYDMCGFANEIYLYNKVEQFRFSNGLSFSQEPSFLYKRDIDKWFPLPYPRFNISFGSMTCNEGRLYLFGGSIDGYASSNLVQAYDIRTNEWLVLPPTRHYHERTSCCMYGKEILVVANDMGGPTNKGEIYNPISGCSRPLTDGNSPRQQQHYPNFVNWSGQLVCYDGRASCNSAVLYYSDTAQHRDWISLPNINDVIAEVKHIPRYTKQRILDIVSF